VAIYREAKQHVGPRYFLSNIPDFGRIVSAKCNANATRVSVIVNKVYTSHHIAALSLLNLSNLPIGLKV